MKHPETRDRKPGWVLDIDSNNPETNATRDRKPGWVLDIARRLVGETNDL